MFIKEIFPRLMLDADTGGAGGTGGSNADDKDIKDTLGGQGEGGVGDTGTGDTPEGALSKDDILKMIQSETDKVRTEYSKKLKDKEKELENIRKESMTEQERKEYELEQLRKDLELKQKDLSVKELTIQTIDLLKDNELPLEAKNFLMGNDSKSTAENIKVFKEMFNGAVEKAVEERFKSSGKDHKQGDDKAVTYTHEMLKSMSADEINKNWDRIQQDLKK